MFTLPVNKVELRVEEDRTGMRAIALEGALLILEA